MIVTGWWQWWQVYPGAHHGSGSCATARQCGQVTSGIVGAPVGSRTPDNLPHHPPAVCARPPVRASQSRIDEPGAGRAVRRSRRSPRHGRAGRCRRGSHPFPRVSRGQRSSGTAGGGGDGRLSAAGEGASSAASAARWSAGSAANWRSNSASGRAGAGVEVGAGAGVEVTVLVTGSTSDAETLGIPAFEGGVCWMGSKRSQVRILSARLTPR